MFLGMSLITLGEIFIFIFKLIWGLTHRRRREEIESRDHVGDPSKKQKKEEDKKTTKDSDFGDEYQLSNKYSDMTPAGNPLTRPNTAATTTNSFEPTPSAYTYNTYQTTFDSVDSEPPQKNIFKRLFSRQR